MAHFAYQTLAYCSNVESHFYTKKTTKNCIIQPCIYIYHSDLQEKIWVT